MRVRFTPLFADVGQFMAIFPPSDPATVRRARIDMLEEEAGELVGAIRQGDGIQIAHEGVDLIYVVVGAFIEAGLTPAQIVGVWREVARANLDKRPPPGPGRKAVKPPGWRKPDVLEAVLRASTAAARLQAFLLYAAIAVVALAVIVGALLLLG